MWSISANHYFSHARDYMIRDQVRTVIEDVQQFDDSAIVISREPWTRGMTLRIRYHLSQIIEASLVNPRNAMKPEL